MGISVHNVYTCTCGPKNCMYIFKLGGSTDACNSHFMCDRK